MVAGHPPAIQYQLALWYVGLDAGIEDTPGPVYTHCLVLSCPPSSSSGQPNGDALAGRGILRTSVSALGHKG